MEPETISKNGASLKSLMSKDNFFKKILIGLAIIPTVVWAQNDELDFTLIQQNDTIFISGKTTPENKIEYNNDSYSERGASVYYSWNSGDGNKLVCKKDDDKVTYDMRQYGIAEPQDIFKLMKSKVLVVREGVKTIREGAFFCFQFVVVVIPASVTNIDAKAFYNCNNIASYNVDAKNKNYSSIDGILYNGDTTTLIICPNGKVGSCRIPASVTEFEKNSFFNRQLKDVYVSWEKPPIVSTSYFGVSSNKIKTLHIPNGTKQSYKNAGWGKFFKNINEEK